jgi:hypothetical protein
MRVLTVVQVEMAMLVDLVELMGQVVALPVVVLAPAAAQAVQEMF